MSLQFWLITTLQYYLSGMGRPKMCNFQNYKRKLLNYCLNFDLSYTYDMIAGIARQLDADATSMELESCVGTLNYMSPEVLQGIGCKDLNSKVSYSVTSLQSTEPSHQIQISVLTLT